MKLLLASFVAAVALMGFGVNAASTKAPDVEIVAASAIDLTKPVDIVPLWEQAGSTTQYAQSLPDCGTVHGQSCATGSPPVRCWWAQAAEPTVCRCLSNRRSCAGLD